jgi:serine/threonine protein kinase
MINTSIGKYKITKLIGEGGMASVYEAEHEMLGTKVAIKVLNPILSANAEIKTRFRNEAKLMASLDHLNITKVIDFDEQPQQLSIVMEFLNGEDLDQRIKRNGPLSEKEISDIFSQTLSAFQYAHEKGIVHRDIKPSNIFILSNGHVKILDFGIAKLFGQGNEMTQTGTQMGTPIYMSPEQVKGDKSIDHRSDIYSLGVTMFFAINGKPPYNSTTDSQFDIFTKIVYEELPEFSIQSKFKDVFIKACQKNRDERFQSCDDYLEAFKLPSVISPESNDKRVVDDNNSGSKKEEMTIIENLGTNDNVKEPVQNQDSKKNSPPKKNKKSLYYLLIFPGIIGLVILFNQLNSNTHVDKNEEINNSINKDGDSTKGVVIPRVQGGLDTINFAQQKTDSTTENKSVDQLFGRHKLSLQWLSWTYCGYVDFVKTDFNTYSISGYQDGNKKSKMEIVETGECDGCYLKIKGVIKKITDKELQFTGRIESSVNHIQNGLPCIKVGTYTFKSTQGRKYWRLQEMDGCEGVTDYVDIYF